MRVDFFVPETAFASTRMDGELVAEDFYGGEVARVLGGFVEGFDGASGGNEVDIVVFELIFGDGNAAVGVGGNEGVGGATHKVEVAGLTETGVEVEEGIEKKEIGVIPTRTRFGVEAFCGCERGHAAVCEADGPSEGSLRKSGEAERKRQGIENERQRVEERWWRAVGGLHDRCDG